MESLSCLSKTYQCNATLITYKTGADTTLIGWTFEDSYTCAQKDIAVVFTNAVRQNADVPSCKFAKHCKFSGEGRKALAALAKKLSDHSKQMKGDCEIRIATSFDETRNLFKISFSSNIPMDGFFHTYGFYTSKDTGNLGPPTIEFSRRC